MRAKSNKKNRFGKQIKIIIALSIVLIISGFSTMLLAKYRSSSGELEDRFNPSVYDSPVISDQLTKGVDGYYYKHNLTVTPDDGINHPVYVRVAVVPTWTDSSGNILGQQPVKEKDYAITFNTDKWFLYTDGYYYCKVPVTGGTPAPELITTYRHIKQLRDAPRSGYDLHVEVAAETIQAIGKKSINTVDRKEVVLDAWGVNPSTHD